MAGEELLRVVVVRRGKVKPTEFRLREGEVGLSLFRKTDALGTEAIIAAVRAVGKQGELMVAEIPARVLHDCGLRLIATPGGTLDPAVNAQHVEARPSWWQRIVLRFRGIPVHEWFNTTVTPRLATAATLVD